jgi:hypothetical protein
MRTATSVALRPDTVRQTVPDTFVGVEVVDAAETAVGAVIDTQFAAAVILLDDALRSGLSTGAVDELAERFEGRGRRHLDRVRAASDVRHESVGESFCAARLAELGLSDVVPQQEFVFEDGSVARVDFWLPSRRIVIEFDGRQKYTDRDMLGGRSPDDVLWDEKRREDRIRPLVDAFVRVRWWHLVDPDRLRALLRSHGVVL